MKASSYSLTVADDSRYRLLVEAVTDYAIYLLDPSGIVSSWNAGAQRFKGYTADEILGEHFSRFYTEDDRKAGAPARALEIATREGRFENEGWRVRKDGTLFWAHVVIDALRSPDGVLLGFAKITRDMTERRKADESLRKSEEQFRLLVQGVTDYAIYMLDREGRVSSWNAGAQRIKGYLPEEIIGQHFSRFYTPEDAANGEPGRALATALNTGSYEKEGWRVRKNGDKFLASVVIDPVRDSSGTVVGFAKITRDITERRNTQRELEKAREALMQSQKMEALGQLTGGIAHDFNNLLMAVLSSLELLKRRIPQDPKLLGLIDNATQGAKRGAALTQRMLAFARRQDLLLRPIDVPAVVKGMNELMMRSLGPSIRIETHFPLSISPAKADDNQFELALLNLALNSRDAMPGGGTMLISAREQGVADGDTTGLSPGRYVVVTVNDNGSGMDAETLARATEPFFTTKGVGKGTGLGLSMVHGLLEQCGGRLIIKSTLGKGTTAEMWLPAVTKAAQELDSSARDTEPRVRNSAELVVLVVDDDDLVLTNTLAMLEDLGHTALRASNALEAIYTIRKDARIDVVVADHAMPGMTGAELIAMIKRERPDIVSILASGYAELPDDVDRTTSRLAKPFTQEQLQRAIAEQASPQAHAPA